jgi:hypothetical protein
MMISTVNNNILNMLLGAPVSHISPCYLTVQGSLVSLSLGLKNYSRLISIFLMFIQLETANHDQMHI